MKALRILFAAVLLAAWLPAQAPVQCYSGAQIVQPCTELTDDVYWASKDPRVRDLKKLEPASDARNSAAQALDAAGLVIDRPIDIWGWDPVLVMRARGSLGYPWSPNAFQPNLVDPLHLGVFLPGTQPTDMSKPWPRSIKTSTLASDYPPFDPPKPVSAPNDGVTWYFDGNTGTYGLIAAAVTGPDGKFIYDEGQQLLYKGQVVYFHVSYSIMGAAPQFVTKKP